MSNKQLPFQVSKLLKCLSHWLPLGAEGLPASAGAAAAALFEGGGMVILIEALFSFSASFLIDA